ncbi:Hsp20/alpha crystallin family protein [Achromobacter sp. NPDC008082]|jgi:HSP20 family protein|uniref:Hsp20/alpha crystallin family protein n=1 Tax=Achromobacter sp. NPDC008082 TaxID=3363888 RepID=UPI0036E019E2
MATYPFFDSGISSALDTLQQLDNLLRSSTAPSNLRSTARAGFPPVNVGTSADSIEVVAFVPGIDPNALEVTMEKGLLTISGERREEEPSGQATLYARERARGRFSRVVELPSDADPENIQARYTDGCLCISIGKRESAKPRQITIQ